MFCFCGAGIGEPDEVRTYGGNPGKLTLEVLGILVEGGREGELLGSM